MKRVVKKKPTKEWGEDAITDALNRCKSGMSVRKAATLCKVPRTTLSRRLKLKGRSNPWGKAPQLDENDELKLIQYAQERATMGLGCTRKSFRRYAGQLADKRGKPFAKGTPSLKWWTLFRRRHPNLTLRQPEPTSLARQQATHHGNTAISNYFHQLGSVLDALQMKDTPKCIYNMDETGFSLSHKPGKVVCR